VAEKSPVNDNRNERVLAYMLAAAIGLSVIAIVAIIAGTGLGVRDFDEGVWPTILVLPTIGLPLGFVLLVALIVMSAVRKSRAARDADL
jgi:uncharacterized membrane protein